MDSLSSYCINIGKIAAPSTPINAVCKTIHFKKSKCILYFVISTFQRKIPHSTQTELIAIVSKSTLSKKRFIHLQESWHDSQLHSGDSLRVESVFRRGDDPLGLYKHSKYSIINDSFGNITVFPHFLVKVSSITKAGSCERNAYFREMYLHNEINQSDLYGRVLQSITEEYVSSMSCSSPSVLVPSVERQYIGLLAEKDIDAEKLHDEIIINTERLNQKVRPPMDPLLFNNGRGLYFETSQYPGTGCNLVQRDVTLYSFDIGLVGRPNLIAQIASIDQYIPIEIRGCKDLDDGIHNAQMTSAAANLMLMKQSYNYNVSDSAFVWFIGSDKRFWVRPRLQQNQGVINLRNRIAIAVARNRPPPIKSTAQCEKCHNRSICDFHASMASSNSKSSKFFHRTNQASHDDAVRSMKSCMRIVMMPVKDRVKQRFALTNLKVTSIAFISEIAHPYSKRTHITLRAPCAGLFYKCAVAPHDELLVTKDGSFPVIAFGNITKVDDFEIQFRTYCSQLEINQTVTVDFYIPSRWYQTNNTSVFNLISNESILRNLVVEQATPNFSNEEIEIPQGLTIKQGEVIKKAMQSKGYLLVDAPPGSGRHFLVSKLIETATRMSKKVLCTVSTYSSLNRICSFLSMPYLVCGNHEKIDEKYRPNSDTDLFESCTSPQELQQRIQSVEVIVMVHSGNMFDALKSLISFDLCIILDATLLPIARALPSMSITASSVLIGDPILDDQESIFHYLMEGQPQCISIREVYSEPAIAEMSKLFRCDLVSMGHHRTVDMKPLAVLTRKIRPIFYEVLSMAKPIVMVSGSPASIVQIALVAGLVYGDTSVVGDRNSLPAVSWCISKVKEKASTLFKEKHVSRFLEAAERVRPMFPFTLRRERVNAVICIGCTSELMKLSLSMAKRKVIFIGPHERCPLVHQMIDELPDVSKMDFGREIVEDPDNPFSPIVPLLDSAFMHDIEDL